ncbi:MAG: hypothetical protein OEM77_03615 [Nitrosopumilus sp.]|nr:hypothetical protein [Nitrosopumilus sp.]
MITTIELETNSVNMTTILTLILDISEFVLINSGSNNYQIDIKANQ